MLRFYFRLNLWVGMFLMVPENTCWNECKVKLMKFYFDFYFLGIVVNDDEGILFIKFLNSYLLKKL